MNKKIIHSIFTILFFCSPFISCIKDDPRLSRSHNKVIDSIAQARTKLIRAEEDSLCDIKFAERINVLTDSIVAERMAEIKRKIEKDAKRN